jgi:UDP-glucose 4-epimerase
MHILITGGAGFIGSNLARLALDAGHEVRVLDDLSTGFRENLAGLDLEFVEGAEVHDGAASRTRSRLTTPTRLAR